MTATTLALPFKWLVDAPEDGGLESRGWLLRGEADTPADAVRAFVAAYTTDCGMHPLEQREPEEVLVCDGSEHLRPCVTRIESKMDDLDVCAGCGHREVVHRGRCSITTHRGRGLTERCACIAFLPVTRHTTIEHELVGEAAVTWARENDQDEQLRYRRCEPDDEGANEWWLIDVVDGCAAHVHENDDGELYFCRKPKGHEGPCMPDLDGLPVREYFELQLIADHDGRLADELTEAIRHGARLSRVTYWFPETQHAPHSTPDGESLPASHRERLLKTAYRRAPRAIVAVEVTYRGHTRRMGSVDPTEAPA